MRKRKEHKPVEKAAVEKKEPVYVPLVDKKFEGELIFKSLDMKAARFEMADVGQEGNRNFSFSAADFPADFDPTSDKVEGSFVLKFRVLRK